MHNPLTLFSNRSIFDELFSLQQLPRPLFKTMRARAVEKDKEFQITLDLPDNTKKEDIAVSLENGVLTVEIGKKTETQGDKVLINETSSYLKRQFDFGNGLSKDGHQVKLLENQSLFIILNKTEKGGPQILTVN